MNTGNTINQLRHKKGLTQKDFADKVNITQSYLSQLEKNLSQPSELVIESICSYIGICIDEFYFLSIDLNLIRNNLLRKV